MNRHLSGKVCEREKTVPEAEKSLDLFLILESWIFDKMFNDCCSFHSEFIFNTEVKK